MEGSVVTTCHLRVMLIELTNNRRTIASASSSVRPRNRRIEVAYSDPDDVRDLTEVRTLELQPRGDRLVRKSVIDAIHDGDWTFEPGERAHDEFHATNAEPGSKEKLEILAQRIRSGLPLWHPDDRHAEDGPLPHAS